MSSRHYSEDDLTLYYYGEGRRREAIERHLAGCPACASLYREISGTLAMISAPEVPERGDQYGLEVWQRIRHKLPERPEPWWAAFFRRDRLVLAARRRDARARRLRRRPRLAAAAGRRPRDRRRRRSPAARPEASPPETRRQRILLTSVADHLDRSERVLTDIMNAPDRSDISSEQRWADDLLTHEPAVSAGRRRRRRAIGGGGARRPRAQPARNRQQPVEDQRGGSRADSAADRRGGAAVQSAGDERRAPAARRRAGSLDPASLNTENQLTIMHETNLSDPAPPRRPGGRRRRPRPPLG